MAAISPAGFQNHIQNPLAAVMYAIMNGAFENARDARRTDHEIARDNEAKARFRTGLEMEAGKAGVDPTGKDETTLAAEVAKIAKANEDRRIGYEAADRATALQREMRNAEKDRLQNAVLRNQAIYDHPFVKGIRGLGSELSDIIQAGIRSHGSRSEERPQVVTYDGVPHEVIQTPDGPALRRMPLDKPGVSSALPPGPRTGPAAGPTLADKQTESLLSSWARNGGLINGQYQK